jgi:hypothetical protein
MRVHGIHLDSNSEDVELSGVIDDYRVWYKFPKGYSVSTKGDAFLAAALLPAMRKGEALEIEEGSPVSSRLLNGADQIQDIFQSWYPFLRKIPIRAQASVTTTGNPGVASFYSGGVDGTHTFLRHAKEITHLIFVKGIDMQLDNDRLFKSALACNRRFAESHGTTLIPVISNVRFFFHSFKSLNWIICQGAGLASIAVALGFAKNYVAASLTYRDFYPWGSQSLTDRLWSTESTEIVHDGAETTRNEKLRKLGEDQSALEILRVCWQDAGYNCGKCEKCLRTRISLRVLGLSAPTLAPLDSLAEIHRIEVYSDDVINALRETIDLSLRRNDRELHKALLKCLRRHDRKKAIVEFDRVFFGGLFKRLVRRAI